MTGSNVDQLQAAMGQAYAIERELGRGGMATVYLARDTKHQRPVALKVLHSNLAASLGPERFRREITTAAQLQHPHILGVFDSGETADGQLWFTMPFVEGESLRDRLSRVHQLPIDDALRVTREIADALDYAHEMGVLHRDIKPENILLTKRGNALLADFGIARALSAGAAKSGDERISLTGTGLAVGTPQYMSPEQASGERELDARSDVYALGTVCYEMLAGEPPFTGPSPQAVIAKMLSTDAPSVRVLRPGVTPAIEAVLARALSRVPADRWATAGEFAAAVNAAEHVTQGVTAHAPVVSAAASEPVVPAATAPVRAVASRRKMPIAAVSLSAGFLIGVGLLFAWSSRSRSGAQDPSGAIRLAVLPFDNVGDTADEYFADGMTEAVHDKLTSVPGLEVIGSASARQYRRTSKSPQQIGQELNVRYIVQGHVRWDKGSVGASRVRVSPELIDVQSAADKWAQPFDAPLTDVFQVQADIAAKVAQSLQVALTPAAKENLESRPTRDLAAYDAYLRGIAALGNGNVPIYIRRALTAFNEAIGRDSSFALAWSAAGNAYALLYFSGVPTEEIADSADRATARALELQPDLADAHVARANYFNLVRNDYARALAEAKLGLAHHQTAALLSAAGNVEEFLGDWDAAAAYLSHAIELDPRNATALSRATQVAFWRRDTAAARAWTERLLSAQPTNVQSFGSRVEIELQRGDLAAARRQIQLASSSVGDAAMVQYVGAYYELGWTLDSARERLLLSLGTDAYDGDSAQWAIVRAQQYMWRGDRESGRKAAVIALRAFVEQIKANPQDDQRHMFAGLALAFLGRYDEAIREGERGATMRPPSMDALYGPYNQQLLARIYTIAGQPERAIDLLEKILAKPYYLTPAWLRIDPTFAPLRGNPRFEKLTASAKPVA